MLSAEAIDFYYDHPVEFFEDILRVKLTGQQEEILNKIPQAIKEKKNIAVRSGHGVGKTFVESGIIIWFLTTRYKAKCIATAPTQTQLYDILWSELSKHNDRSLLREYFEMTASRFAMKASSADWFAIARSTNKPENFQGHHGSSMIFVIDEASGVDDEIMEVIEGACTEEGNIMIMFGNPTKLTGGFYEAFNSKAEFYFTMTMSCLDSSNVSELYPKQIEAKYGVDSDVYRVRVLGEFPNSEEDTIIPMDLINSAMNRDTGDYFEDGLGTIEIGCDVARFGSDETSIYVRRSNYIQKEWISKSNSTMDIVGRIVDFVNRNKEKASQFIINIDDTGVGGGVTDRLREILNSGGMPRNTIVNAVNNNNRAKTVKLYKNVITEMWFYMREFLSTGVLEYDDKMFLQLRSRRYGFNSDGRMMVESKDNVKKRGLTSPDRADGMLLTCYSLLGKDSRLQVVREKGVNTKVAKEQVKKIQTDIVARIEWYKKQKKQQRF